MGACLPVTLQNGLRHTSASADFSHQGSLGLYHEARKGKEGQLLAQGYHELVITLDNLGERTGRVLGAGPAETASERSVMNTLPLESRTGHTWRAAVSQGDK